MIPREAQSLLLARPPLSFREQYPEGTHLELRQQRRPVLLPDLHQALPQSIPPPMELVQLLLGCRRLLLLLGACRQRLLQLLPDKQRNFRQVNLKRRSTSF